MKRKGFTLIEMAVVVIIIGILASFAVARYNWVVERPKGAEAKNILYNAFLGYRRVVTDGDSTSSLSWTRLGMSDPNSLSTRYFNYAPWPSWASPSQIRATRIGNSSRWLNISLSNGAITKSFEY